MTTAPAPLVGLSDCYRCSARGKHVVAPVPGRGSFSSRIMLVGESPGRQENTGGRPWVGEAGRELENYLSSANLLPEDVYLTNLVKCWPGPGDPDPKPECIQTCSLWLSEEIATIRPSIIIAAGFYAIRWLLHDDDATVEDTHGIPVYSDVLGDGNRVLVLPMYHPAAGLHEVRTIRLIRQDLDVLRRIVAGEDVESLSPSDPFLGAEYYSFTGEPLRLPPGCQVVSLDTETTPNGGLLCLSVSFQPGEAFVVWCDDVATVMQPLFDNPDIIWCLHNQVFDIRVLREAGFRLAGRTDDTMVMAHLLQMESASLKRLARRVLGMHMDDYADVVYSASQRVAVEYLGVVASRDWGKPEPVEEVVWKSGVMSVRTRQPQPIQRKVRAILADVADGKRTPTGLLVDPRARWKKFSDLERKTVEGVLGPMPGASLSDVPPARALHYSARDADATLRLREELRSRMSRDGIMLAYEEIDMPVLPMVSAMMERGMPVDVDALLSLRGQLVDRQNYAMVQAWLEAGRPFNPGSGPQVAALLFSELSLPILSRTTGGVPSTSDDVLKKLHKRHPVISHITEHRRLGKMIDSFIDPLVEHGRVDGRIHCDLRTTGTVTHRLAARNPNLMAMPVRHDEGRMVRDCFVAPYGSVILAVDLSQIDMRIFTHRSHDAALMHVFLSGGDVHAQTAAAMFHIPVSEVDERKHRYPAKRTGFGVIFGITDVGLLRDLEDTVPDGGWTLEGSAEFLRSYFDTHPGVVQYIEEQHMFARRYGYVMDMFGRRRDLPELRSSVKRVVERGLREAVNTSIQMSTAGMIKIHMREIWRGIQDDPVWQRTVFPLIQIHDDIVFEVAEDELLPFASFVVNVMRTAVPLSVPVDAEAKWGRTWGTMKKLEI